MESPRPLRSVLVVVICQRGMGITVKRSKGETVIGHFRQVQSIAYEVLGATSRCSPAHTHGSGSSLLLLPLSRYHSNRIALMGSILPLKIFDQVEQTQTTRMAFLKPM
jgi:hypothetical protein